MDKQLIIVGGPTASGKTGLAIKIAKHFETEVVNFDSRQFYKELNIGTAKPNAEELEGVPHHLLGHISITEPYTVASYAVAARDTLKDLFETKQRVIMVGGSGLYIKSLLNGVDEMPEISPELREELKQKFQAYGLEWLQVEVKKHDIDYYNSSDNQNHVRLLRALEVITASGMPFSSFRKGGNNILPYSIKEIGLEWDREALYQRCDLRVSDMMNKGLLKEVADLYEFKDLQALRTVGYTELFSFLNGEISLDEAVALIQKNTRNYAKRQLTWFKNQHLNMQWFAPTDTEGVLKFLSAN